MASGSFITIGCRLPHGVVLPALTEGGETFTLAGTYSHKSFNSKSGLIAPWAFGKTTIPADYWSEFKKKFHDWTPLKKGVIYEIKNPKDAEKMAIELQDEKTGVERIDIAEMKKTGATAIDPKTLKEIK